MTTINLRLSPALETRAREHADHLGISINALMSVAADAYFRALDGTPRFVTRGESNDQIDQNDPTTKSAGISAPGANATKKERQAWTAFQRAQRKLEL